MSAPAMSHDPAVLTVVNNWGTIPIREAWNLSDLPPATSPHRDEIAAVFGKPVRHDDAYLVGVADTLYSVIAASAADRPPLVNELIVRTRVRPVVMPDGALRWAIPDDPHGVLASGVALLLANGGNESPLRVCHAHRCVDVFLDGSNAHTRRYCSPSCQERARQRAFRQRRRATA